MPKNLKNYSIVFTASACSLTLLMAAVRTLAPIVDISIYTFTASIGTILAGIGIGNYLGGLAADKYPQPKTIGLLLLSSAILSFLLVPFLILVEGGFSSLPLIIRAIMLSFSLFFLPCLALGMIGPVVIKQSLDGSTDTGATVGKIYTASTAGSIFGICITGFLLLQWMGVKAVIMLTGCILFTVAIVFGELWKKKILNSSTALSAVFVLLGVFNCINGAWNSNFLLENKHHSIQLKEKKFGNKTLQALQTDNQTQGYSTPENPTFLGRAHERILANLINFTAKQEKLNLLFLGGGYTLPHYTELKHKDSNIELFELDSSVKNLAEKHLGLSTSSKIKTLNTNVRPSLDTLQKNAYNLIIGNPYQGTDIQAQHASKEFNDQIKHLLSPNGTYISCIVDTMEESLFLSSFIQTLKLSFPHVYLLRSDTSKPGHHPEVFVIAASLKRLTAKAYSGKNKASYNHFLKKHFLSDSELSSWLSSRETTILTDDYAPVERLIYPILKLGELMRLSYQYYYEALELKNNNDTEEAFNMLSKALELNPKFDWAYLERSSIYHKVKKLELALKDCESAIEVNPKYSKAYNNRANIYKEMKYYERSIDDYTRAIELEKLPEEQIYLYSNRGNAHMLTEEYEKALSDFSFVSKHNPNSELNYFHLGQANYKLRNYKQSIEDYSKAIELNPKNPQSYKSRSKAYLQSRRFMDAENDYSTLIRFEPNNPENYNFRGETRVNLRKLKEALSDYNKAIELNPRYAAAYANRALLNTLLGNDSEVEADVQTAVKFGMSENKLRGIVKKVRKERMK